MADRPFERYRGPNELTPNEFSALIARLELAAWTPKVVTLHHTYKPDLSSWQGLKSLDALERYYYITKKWHRGPHFFVSDEAWYLLSPPERPGVHSLAFNATGWGVEVIHDGDKAPLGDHQAKTLYQGLGSLFKKLKLNPATALRFHRDDPRAYKTCPGLKITKADILAGVLRVLNPGAKVTVDSHPENAPQGTKLLFFGKSVDLENMRLDGVTYVKLRETVPYLKARLEYKPGLLKVYKDQITLDLTQEVNIIQGVSWVSLRALAEALGYACLWDAKKKSVHILKK
jgi:hypothetical protein